MTDPVLRISGRISSKPVNWCHNLADVAPFSMIVSLALWDTGRCPRVQGTRSHLSEATQKSESRGVDSPRLRAGRSSPASDDVKVRLDAAALAAFRGAYRSAFLGRIEKLQRNPFCRRVMRRRAIRPDRIATSLRVLQRGPGKRGCARSCVNRDV